MWFLSLRQLLSRPQQTILTFIGIMLGTATYVIFTGMMLGFQEYLIEKMINDSPHVTINPRDELITPETFDSVFFPGSVVKWITPPSGKKDNQYLNNVQGWFEKLDNDPRVVAYAPRLARQVIFTNGKQSVPGWLTGIDDNREKTITSLHKSVITGDFKVVGEGESVIVIGEGLMKRLGARLEGTITAVSASGESHPLKIKGIIRMGIRQFDDSSAYASIQTVQNVTSSAGQISSVGIKLEDVTLARELADTFALYTSDKVESWDQANENILSVFKTQDIMRNAITGIIIIVIGFGIYNILNMVVSQKKREIAILRSIGYDARDIIFLFLIQGSFLGLSGGFLGLIFGGVSNYLISQIEVSRSFGSSNTMMVSWNIMIYIYGFLITVIATTVASIIPARMASRLSPIDIIRGSS